MAVPVSKTELIAAITVNFDRLAADLARVPPESSRQTALPGHVAGTLISPADLVAYLLGWNRLVLSWLERDDHGLPVDFPETGYNWNQLGPLAQKFYADYQDLGWEDLRSALTAAKDDLLRSIAARTDQELYGAPWYGKYPKGRMIQFNSASPYANARRRIRRWLNEKRPIKS